MHLFSQSFNYDYSWARVVVGIWHKYPNPYSSHVLTVDVVDRSVDPQTGVIRTERILGCKQKLPAMISRLFGTDDAYVREVSVVDPRTQEATVTSCNMTLCQVATCDESIRYVASPSNPTQTGFTQTAEIQARMALWRSAADGLERFLVQRFEANAELGKIALTDVLQRLWGQQLQQTA